eukprot:TRINITY_DN28603_c0_g1_i1.p1 TRINITY_DN28603_c0_g1~~TRINITY_DN28603_c0_g1_i1.p1  ORF type:complete len:159 (-),score=17.79 TRINITY_DN28603_c0_g1_i1:18-494(-)
MSLKSRCQSVVALLVIIVSAHVSPASASLKNLFWKSSKKDETRDHSRGHEPCIKEYGAEATPRISVSLGNSNYSPSSSCTCDATENEDCRCTSGCTQKQALQVCQDILGPCKCIRSEATCECSGHCASTKHREEACEDEPGCEWEGQWCNAQVGILWD